MKDYKELRVWQKSMELVTELYRIIKLLPREETFALSDQMRRAAISIPSNIAEGYNRNSDQELLNFLYISRGSTAELETQIMIAISLKYFSDVDAEKALDLCGEVRRMLNSFISHIRRERISDSG